LCVAPSNVQKCTASVRSPDPQEEVKNRIISNAESPMFMRVRRTVPQFTFGFSENFVNPISSVSTGFFRFFSVLFEYGHIRSPKTRQKRPFHNAKGKGVTMIKMKKTDKKRTHFRHQTLASSPRL
jgi:hypothetical protein